MLRVAKRNAVDGSGDTLYGTAYNGGSSGYGTVFKVNTNGAGFTTLHSFTAAFTNAAGAYTNSDGANPEAGLIISGSTLFGSANYGGSSGNGTVFVLSTNGTAFTTLHNFTATDPVTGFNNDGANPFAGLVLSENTLYGTAESGGSSGNGTVFSLSLGSVNVPRLTIIRSGVNVILTWPSNAAGFTLQSVTNFVLPAVWTNVAPGAVVVNGQNTVTNPISSARKFYR